MPGYVALPAYRAPTAINFDPLNEGLDDLSKQFEKNRLLRQAQAVGAALVPDAPTQTTPNPLMAPQSAPASPAQASAAAAGRDFPNPTSGTDYSPAIKGIESGGNYKAVGPITASGDRAYGAHQVMGANIPVWTKEVLGQSLTPQQYLDNPDAQEKVFRAKFGQYVAKTGNPQDAASMWFTGKPLAQGANRKDLYGTTGNEYVNRFNAASGSAPATSASAQAAPAAPPGPNYRKAAAIAASQGNLAVATQLLALQTEQENTAYTRGRETRKDVREEQTFKDAQHKVIAERIGGIAQTIASEPDPIRQKAMVDQLLASHPEIAPGLQKYGVPLNDPAAVTKYLIADAQGFQKPEFTAVSAGASLYDRGQGKVVFTAPAKPDAASIPSGYRVGADGRSLEFIPGGPADPSIKGKDKFNEQQLNASNFANMMTEANQKLEAMSPKDAKGQRLTDAAGNPIPIENPKNILGAIRDGIMPFEGARNYVTPGDTQAYNQAANQWIRAKLRKESGAAIGKDEMEKEFITYFPQYGDGPEVLKLKADARAAATKGMIAQAGGAYQHYFPQSANQPGSAQGAVIHVNSPAEVQQLIKDKKLQSGDHFIDEHGVPRTVN